MDTPRKINSRKGNNRPNQTSSASGVPLDRLSHIARGEFASTADVKKMPELAVPQRLMGRPFEPGHPKLPGAGRPKGVVAMIREATDDGRELIRLALRIARGEPFKDARGRGIRRPKDAVQLEAIRWVGDRLWGRIPVADGDGTGPEVIILKLKPGQDF